MFEEDERVYVNGEAALVSYTYTSTNGTRCVHLYNGRNVPASDVMSYNDYWRRQRDMLAEKGLLEASQ